MQNAEVLNTMVAAAQALCSVMHEMNEQDYVDHPLCQYLLAAAHVGIAQTQRRFSGSIVSLANNRPRLFQQSFLAMSQRVLLPSIASESIEGSVKSLGLDLGCSLLVHPECRREGLFDDKALREGFLHTAMALATAIDISEFSSEDEATAAYFSDDGGAASSAFFDDGSNEEDSEDAVACEAITNLESMAQVFDSDEIVQVCLMPAWGQVDSSDWQARRAGLVVAGVVSEGAADSMRPLMSQIVPKNLAIDIRFPSTCALLGTTLSSKLFEAYCTFRPWEEEGYDAEDAELDDQGGGFDPSNMNSNLSECKSDKREPSFRELFCETMPSALCVVIEQNSTCDRIVHAAMYCLRLFFDPDQCQYCTCRTENTDKATFYALNLCLSILQSWGNGSIQKPLYLIAEAASLYSVIFMARALGLICCSLRI